MKKKSTTVILIVLIIAVIGCTVAFFMMENSNVEDITTTTQTTTTATVPSSTAIAETQTTQATTVTDTTQTTAKAESTQATTVRNDYIGKGGEISVNEAFDKLYEHYGDGYDINCIDQNTDTPVFKVVDIKTGDLYARVTVNLNNSIATEKNEATQETKDFALFG